MGTGDPFQAQSSMYSKTMFGLSVLKSVELFFTDLSVAIAEQPSTDAPATRAHCFKKFLRSLFIAASLFIIFYVLVQFFGVSPLNNGTILLPRFGLGIIITVGHQFCTGLLQMIFRFSGTSLKMTSRLDAVMPS